MQEARSKIKKILLKLQPEEAIAVIESLGKEFRRDNSIRLSGGVRLLEYDRPDLIDMKR